MSTKRASQRVASRIRVERHALREHILSELLNAGMVALCAGPGMGKSWLAQELLASEKARGSYCLELKLKKPLHPNPDKPLLEKLCAELARAQRSVKRHANNGQSCVVVCDDVSPFDEYELQLVVPALERLRLAGCSILLCVRPEASQLLDDLDVVCFGPFELQISYDELEQSLKGHRLPSAQDLLRLTQGVPVLVCAISAKDGHCIQDIQESSAFLSTLNTYGLQLLRKELLEDELRMRLALCLLGSGSLDTLDALPIASSREILASLADDTPFFGVDFALARFSCAAFDEKASIARLSTALKQQLSSDSELLDACIELLEQAGNLERTLALTQLKGEDADQSLMLRHGPSFLDLGYKRQVEDALVKLGDEGSVSFEAQVTRATYACLEADDESYRVISAELAKPHNEAQELLCSQLAAARLVRLASRHCLVDLSDFEYGHSEATEHKRESSELLAQINTHDDLSARLLMHARMIVLMSEGRLEQVLGELLSSGTAHVPKSLSECLLCDDLEISRSLMGVEIHTREAQRVQDVSSFLARGDYHDQLAYHADIVSLIHGLGNGLVSSERADRCLTIAARRGDTLIQSFALLCTSIRDLSARNAVRAHVCAGQADDLSVQAQAPLLQRIAKLLQQVADYLAKNSRVHHRGELVKPHSTTGHTKPKLRAANPDDAWSVVEAMVDATLSHDLNSFERAARVAERISCPPLADLALQFVIRSLGSAAEPLRTAVAELWGIEVRTIQREHVREPDNYQNSELLEIKMMGEFAVYLKGERLSDKVWGRSSSKALLAMLAVARGHTLSRAEVIKTLWPHGDALSARNSVYTATAKLRSILGQNSRGEDYLLRDEVLCLNEGLMRCDIDEFMRDARAAITSNHTSLRVLHSCEDIARRYSPELIVPKVESANFFVERQEELQVLYGDVMMAGAEAALTLSMYRKAAFLAQEVLQMGTLREDALRVLLHTLMAQGRISEARMRYTRFARAYEAREGMPPSQKLREILYGTGLDDGAAAELGSVADNDAAYEPDNGELDLVI